MQLNSAQTLEQLDPFDHAFVDAVLRIRGVDEMPTFEQFKDAILVLEAYYSALMKAPSSKDPRDEGWLDGHTIESAASQFAFLFNRFDVLYVSQATHEQLAAFTEWWTTGDMPNELKHLSG